MSAPLHLAPGDLVLLTTDGVLEARSPAGEVFDDERMLELVRLHQHRSAAEIIDCVQQGVLQFTGRNHAQDDLTLVILKVAWNQ